MPHLIPSLAVIGAALTLVWVLASRTLLAASRSVRLLAEVLPGSAEGRILPSLSVVVTARNEADQIEATVRSVLQQRYPGLEVVVVDDRSCDGTREVLERLAEKQRGTGRLRVIHNEALPEGWTGKCHACHLGAQHSTGGWILFTDADVRFARDDVLARIVDHAQRRALDHVTVIPDLRPMSSLQAGLVALFGQMLMLAARAHEMDRDQRRGGIGVGAFNLVRRAAYDRIGGHAPLKMELADDFKLGMLLKESGARQRLYNGLGLIRCPWHRGVMNVVRGLEKNFFAGFDFSLLKLILWTVVVGGLNFGPLAVGLALTLRVRDGDAVSVVVAAWLPLAAQAGLVAAAYFVEAPRQGYQALTLTLLHPVSVVLLIATAWNSALRTLSRRGVWWRGTFYPLALLRAGLVRPGDGQARGAAQEAP